MSFKLRKPKQEQWDQAEELGKLRIEVPHWAVEVNLFNSLLQPVAQADRVKSDSQSRSGFSMESLLAPGAYQVQMSLEGKTESEWVLIDEGKVTEISPKAWANLKFTSASPLNDTGNFNRTHTAKAVELSRATTWHYKSGGNSRLFLFVRTLDPKAYGETFSDGLALLDEKGQVITDFSEGIEKDKKHGWMGFNADLPSGGYILRRGRSGVRLRFQVFYLCDGWATHVFLNARSYPTLNDWSLNTARRGTGFQPNSETVLAAEVIIDNLRHNSNGLFLLRNEKIKESIDILLDEKIGNPCLGILAAHAIMSLREEVIKLQSQAERLKSQAASEDESLPEQSEAFQQARDYFHILEDKVIPFLKRTIGDHPEVRALCLSNDSPASRPFDFPPSLLASLQLVQAHSLRFTDTITPDSLTDCVSDNLVINGPWTAWRHLDRPPKPSASPQNRGLAIKKMDEAGFPVSAVLSQTVAPRTPVYHLAGTEAQLAQESATETVLKDAPMIQKAKEVVLDYAKNFKMEELPSVINLNSEKTINDILARVTPEEVSLKCGIPLSRTEDGLKSLHSKVAAGPQSDEATDAPSAESSSITVQQAILEYALSKTQSETTEKPRAVSKYTIREIVHKIQSEADRISVVASSMKSSDASIDTIARDLYSAAQSLLKHADFALITDESGKIHYSNGAFSILISPRYDDRATMTKKEVVERRSAKCREWEQILEGKQSGLSEIENPYETWDWRSWKLSRTEMKDEAASRSTFHLNLLRLIGSSPLNDESLQEFDSLAGRITLYVPLLVYGSEESKKEYEEKINTIIVQIQTKLNEIKGA
jgi:hypothetical protein